MTAVVQTEKRCARCGEVKSAERYRVLTTGRLASQCRPCSVATERERHRAQPGRRAASNAAYRSAHREQRKAYDAARYAADPEQAKARSIAWYRRNPARRKATVAAWQRTHPEVGAHYCAIRRARKTGNGGSHTLAEWREKCALFANLCAYCGEARPLERDHAVPLARGGGSDDITNIIPACRACNARKGTHASAEYLMMRAA